MVNTFVPHSSYIQSAKALDVKRLGKQRVEALQILRANLGLTKGWKNHPAAVMWRGHEGSLCLYTLAICNRWRELGYKDNVAPQVLDIMANLPASSFRRPWWVGKSTIHLSHQSNLKRKDPIHYKYKVNDDLPYQWPTEDKTFRTTTSRKTADGRENKIHNNSSEEP